MSAEYVRSHYGVPAKRGGRIRFTGGGVNLLGTIVAFDMQYLKVRFDGERRSVPLHPTWEVEYLEGEQS